MAENAVAHFHLLLSQANFTAENFRQDYGYDIVSQTFDCDWQIEPGFVVFQIKSTDKLEINQRTESIPVRIDRRDLTLWANEINPFFLIVYNVGRMPYEAYWLNLKTDYQQLDQLLPAGQKTVKLHVPARNRVTVEFMEWIREYKAGILKQIEEKVDYGYFAEPG